MRDELGKKLGDEATEAIMNSPFLFRLQSDPIYVHHYDEEYWAEFVYSTYKKKEATTI